MASTIKQRLRRYNGTDYDTIHLETEKSCITDFPTSMPASDVYDWAKAASKPSYSTSELSNWPSGGTDGQVLGLASSSLAWITAGGGGTNVQIDTVTLPRNIYDQWINIVTYTTKPLLVYITTNTYTDGSVITLFPAHMVYSGSSTTAVAYNVMYYQTNISNYNSAALINFSWNGNTLRGNSDGTPLGMSPPATIIAVF